MSTVETDFSKLLYNVFYDGRFSRFFRPNSPVPLTIPAETAKIRKGETVFPLERMRDPWLWKNGE